VTRFYKRYVITRSPAMGRPRFSYRVYKPAGIDGPWICIGSATSRRGAHEIDKRCAYHDRTLQGDTWVAIAARYGWASGPSCQVSISRWAKLHGLPLGVPA
jgi:hypothetical protein